jgi:hypothetical protein
MRVRQFAQQPLKGRGFTGRQVERMHAYRAVDIAVLFAQGLDRTGILGTDANAQEVPHSTVTGRLQGGIEGAVVGAQVKSVEVAMGIYEHGMTAHMK